jgi:hypothetical protein
MTVQFLLPSPRVETPTPNVEPQTSPEALGEGGTMVHALAPYHQPQGVALAGEAEIGELERARRTVTAKVFNDRWGFADFKIDVALEEVEVGSSYDTVKHGKAVIDEINGWLLDPEKPLGPVVALLELVAETAQEQDAQDMLNDLREQVRDLVAYHASSKDTATFERARVLEANLPDSLR